MAILVHVVLSIDSADLLVGYSAGAKVYLYSAATEAGTYSSVTSTAIVSGTEDYEFWDANGESTTWYKARAGNSAGTAFSDYSAAFRVAAVASAGSAYTSIALIKASQDISDSTTDSVIQTYVDAANRRLINFIGGFIGPTGDTARTYDYPEDAPNRRCFRIPTGIRSIGTLTVAPGTGQTPASVASDDLLLRPRLAERTSRDDPATEVWLSDNATGDVSGFTPGYDVIAFATSVFDWAATPPDLIEIATTLGRRMFKARQSATGDVVGSTAWGTAMFSRFLSKDDIEHLRWWRAEISRHGGI